MAFIEWDFCHLVTKITGVHKSEAVKLWDQYPDLHCLVGATRGLTGDWESALLESRRALELNPDYAEANVHFTKDGRFITVSDVRHAARICVIGPDLADTLFPLQDPIGRQLTLDGRAYEVVGVFERKGSAFGGSNDNHLAIPISAFDEQFPEVKNGGGDTIHIATVPRRPQDYDALIEEETAILRARRGLRPGQPNDFALFTTVGQLRQFQQITGGVAAVMLVIAGIALLVGGVGVMNIMLVNVTQRTREIGVRKAVGARRRDSTAQFLVEALLGDAP